MPVLAIESATAQTGVALRGPDGHIAAVHVTHRQRHVETLAPAIDFVCRHAGVDIAGISAVIVDVGPGTFTGLRVGLATAKALAYAQGISVSGVCSLDVLAYPARLSPRRIVSVIDALRDEVFWASYAGSLGGVRRLTPPALARPEDLAEQLRASQDECLVLGDGALRYADLFTAIPNVQLAGDALKFPNAEAMLAMTADPERAAEVLTQTIDIIYLREPYIHPQHRGSDQR